MTIDDRLSTNTCQTTRNSLNLVVHREEAEAVHGRRHLASRVLTAMPLAGATVHYADSAGVRNRCEDFEQFFQRARPCGPGAFLDLGWHRYNTAGSADDAKAITCTAS